MQAIRRPRRNIQSSLCILRIRYNTISRINRYPRQHPPIFPELTFIPMSKVGRNLRVCRIQ